MALNQSSRLIRMTKGPLGARRGRRHQLLGTRGDLASVQLRDRVHLHAARPQARRHHRRGADHRARSPRSNARAARRLGYFHGYVSRFAAGNVVFKDPGEHKYRHYRAEIVPWLWFLTQTARCYLFFPEKEEKSIFEVIEAVINRAKSDLHVNPVADLKGIGDLGSRKVKHCVQYRETDFNFLSRTLEQYGVFYYFKFEDGKHTLVLDLKKNYPACEEAEVTYPRVHWRRSRPATTSPAGSTTTSSCRASGRTPTTTSRRRRRRCKASAPKLPSVDLPHGEQVRDLRLSRRLRRQAGRRDRTRASARKSARRRTTSSTGPAPAAPSRRATSSR